MYFNRKNTEQKNWRMIKKGKHFLFGCSLVLAIGAVMAAPSVKADEADATDANGVSTSASENESATITSGTNPSTYSAPAGTTATPVVTTSNSSASVESSSTTQKESDSVQAPSLTTVADASALTAEEISNVTEAIKGSNPTAVSVQVSNDGSAVVTFADGSSATLSASQTVKVKPEATSTSEAPTRSRRALSPANGISTRSFDSELQTEAQEKAIYSPGEKGQKQGYEGKVWLYRNGTLNNSDQEDAKPLGGVNVYL